MSKHSKEPWAIEDESTGTIYSKAVGSEYGYQIAICDHDMTDFPDDVIEDNARRIVACVNICAGISTEELEQQHDLVSAQLASEQADPASPSPTLQTIPTEGLVWVCLNVEGMSSARARTAMLWLSGALTKAKKDGKTSAQFILTASLWPGQMQIQALPDDQLTSMGLMRTYVAKGLRQELINALAHLVAVTTPDAKGQWGAQEEHLAALETANAAIARANGENFTLSPEAFARFEKQLEGTPMSENEALQTLLARPKPWADRGGDA